MLANGRAADPRTEQQCWRFDRSTSDDYRRRVDRKRGGRAVLMRNAGLDPGGTPVLHEHALGMAADDEPRPSVSGVLKERLHRRLLAAPLTATGAISADTRVVARRVGVARQSSVWVSALVTSSDHLPV